MSRPRIGRLMALIVVAALGLKVALIVQEGREWESRRLAFSGMGMTVQPSAFRESELVAALEDRQLRSSAVWALDRIGSTSPALVRALAEILETQTEALWHGGRRDPQQVDPARALKRIKPPAEFIVPLLGRAMASEDRWVRLQVVEVLSEVAGRPGNRPPALATLLLMAIRDREPRISMQAAEALAGLDDGTRRQAIGGLLQQLRGPGRPAQFLAAINLGRFGPEAEAGAAILVDRLRDGGVAGRLADLYMLGRLGPAAKAAVPAVVRAMTAPDAGEDALQFLDVFRTRPDVWQQPWSMGKVLESEEWGQTPTKLCPLGAKVLGKIGPGAEGQAIEILNGMAQGEDATLRLRAAEALGAIGPKASAAIPTLVDRMEHDTTAHPGDDDDFEGVMRRVRAVEQVCAGGEPRFVTALIRMLGSGNRQKSSEAAWALGRLARPPADAAPILMGLLQDWSQKVRSSAASTLGRYDWPEFAEAVPALLDALEDRDVWVRTQVAMALARHRAGSGRAVPVVIPMLRGENPSLRSLAAEILAAYGKEAAPATPALIEARHDAVEFVRDEVEKALKAVASPAAADPVTVPGR